VRLVELTNGLGQKYYLNPERVVTIIQLKRGENKEPVCRIWLGSGDHDYVEAQGLASDVARLLIGAPRREETP